MAVWLELVTRLEAAKAFGGWSLLWRRSGFLLWRWISPLLRRVHNPTTPHPAPPRIPWRAPTAPAADRWRPAAAPTPLDRCPGADHPGGNGTRRGRATSHRGPAAAPRPPGRPGVDGDRGRRGSCAPAPPAGCAPSPRPPPGTAPAASGHRAGCLQGRIPVSGGTPGPSSVGQR